MAATNLQLEIITPTGVKLSAGIEELTAPSIEGQFGVLPGHRPLLASLTTGLITYRQSGKEEVQVAVGAGYVQVQNDRAVVLTDRYAEKSSIDPVSVRLELKQADDALDTFEGNREGSRHAQLVAEELWAATLLELYGDPPPPTMRGFEETAGPADLSRPDSEET